MLNRRILYPLKVVLSDPKRTNWPSRKIILDATGLGGGDLPSPSKADITVRTDKHKQNIYGPSMTTVETVANSHAWGRTVSTALGISKAAHEFLVLHYFATDSIPYWNAFIHEVMPLVPLPTPAVRRAEVEELLRRTHIAPSHRRTPHHTWKDALSLVMDLLLGFGKRRYFNMARVWQRATSVHIKGFSAGSYVGLALVHVFREIKSIRTCSVLGAIACPPSFLKVPDDRHTVHLLHYVPDKLCRWNPVQPFLETLRCKSTIVHGHFDLHQHHFGKDEHNYAHWLNLQLEGGIFSLPHLMMRYDDAALSQRRDAAPLRLISWLTFSLPYALQDFVEVLMTHYGNRDPESTDKLHEYLAIHCPRCSILEHPDVIRDHIVNKIRDWNQEWQPKSLLDLFEGFLARMPLHRLAHFLDMVLPQLSPMHTRWDDPQKTLLCCHFFRLARTQELFAQVRLQYLFTSRALIYMVRINWERQPMLLFSDPHRVDPVSFRSFHEDRSLGKHNIQMGLPEGHSVLLHFSHNGRAYQAVLVSMSSAPSKSKKGEHAMWKHVLPVSTDFAWLPNDVADALCPLALHQDLTRPYGSFHEMQLGFNEHYQASLHIEGLYYLGETRSVEEFNIFSQMPAERLCLGCGVQSDERFGLMPPQDRGRLVAATIRLLQLVLTNRPQDATDDEKQIWQALQPLVHNRDGHFLATLSALLLSLLEGKTDCPITAVFGAGKTRAAAAIIAGLITVDPSLKIMILTKENVASQAFAEHIIALSLPTWIENKIGRLVGFMALHNQTTGTTKLDIPSAHRHEVIGSKQVIIGCGGGFRHECASKYSPVAQWMSEVDLTLHDESQQYGNLDEMAALARLPRNCLVVWLGDHRQTPGGLRKSAAARRFRRKLLQRPLALRGNSTKVQPNTLHQIVGRYLTGTPSSPAYPVAQLMAPDLLLPQNSQEHLENLAEELLGAYNTWHLGMVPRTALAVLWLATHRHDVEPMVAQELIAAAGLRGKQNWALILSSSARVSEVTYETVVAVRYPELDAAINTRVVFGNYLADRQARIWGYLPVFWRSPHSVVHATGDIGQMISWISEQVELEAGENGCLAVLHNRNDMSGALNSSVWVANSEGRVISRGVTSCAGMTAQHVLLAQTKIGFLTGGRGYSFQELSPEDKQSQREEAFARATVALTRAQRFCFIMCPLDMKGIIGAATVVGCLQHGVGICDERSTGSSLLVELKTGSLAQSRDDSNFLEAFRLSATVKTGEFPPAALVELYHEPEASTARLRRLHLVIVDLLHPRKKATWTEKHFYKQITGLGNDRGDNVTPIPLCNQEEWRCRYVFGYCLDDSDKPVYLIWPERTRNNGFWILDTARNQYHNLCQTVSICNLGLEHFYAAFGLGCSRDLRTSSARAFGISINDISEDCSVLSGPAKGLRPLTHGTPRETHILKRAKIEPKPIEEQPVEEVKEESCQDGSDTEDSSSSQSSSTTEADDIESDLECLEEHYYSDLRRYTANLESAFSEQLNRQQLNNQEWDFCGGREGIQRFLTLPTTWPLARLMFPIRDLRKQMETLLQTYCFEIEVTCARATEQDKSVQRMALHLVQYLAVFLAETITGLLQRVLTHPARGLVDDTNAALLTQKFWVQAIYTELLCASSRHWAVREQEKQRPPTGLAKVVCLPFDGAAARKHGRRNPTDARFETMLGGSSWVDSLFVWFPASWMPLVVEAIREKSFAHHQIASQIGAPASTDQTQIVLPKGLDFTYKVKRWQAEAKGCCPVLQSRINVDWLTFDPQMFAPLFPRLKEGILCDVFIQKAVVAWDSAPGNRIMVSLLLPGPMEMDQWLKEVRACINMWPLQKTTHLVSNQMATDVFMRRERRRLQARHIWDNIEPVWAKIRDRVWTKQATGLPYDALFRRLFLHDYKEETRWLENSYKGQNWRWVQEQWKNCRTWFAEQAVARFPSQWVSTLYLHGLDQLDALAWQWMDQHENLLEQVWHTRQGTFRRKRPPDVRDDPMRDQ